MADSRDDRISELEAELAAAVVQNAEQAKEIAALKEQVAELLERINQNSSNSHKPPSSDPPGNRKQRRAKDKQKRRKRGGQKGHKGSRRNLLPPEQVDKFVITSRTNARVAGSRYPRSTIRMRSATK